MVVLIDFEVIILWKVEIIESLIIGGKVNIEKLVMGMEEKKYSYFVCFN